MVTLETVLDVIPAVSVLIALLYYTMTLKKAEKARKNVGNQIKSAFKEIGKNLPRLERYLIQCIPHPTSLSPEFKPDLSETDKSVKWYISW